MFETAMNDDLNTSVALSVIFRLVAITNEYINYKGSASGNKGNFMEINKLCLDELGGDVLGIVKEQYQQQSEWSDWNEGQSLIKTILILNKMNEEEYWTKEMKDWTTKADKLLKEKK